MSRSYLALLFILIFFNGLSQPTENSQPNASIGIVGSPEDVSGKTEAGYVLAGGGKDQEAAIKWMIERAGGGDFVVIRSSGSTGYNDYLYEMGGLNSVETLMIDSREKAMRKEVGQRIREAEALFIAGGDQWNYVNFWKDSEVSSALQYLIDVKKVPIGGTSAGCAVLSGIIFDAQHDTVVSKDALANPYASQVSISKSFIQLPFLANTIADQHYSQRDRLGRHVVFLARMTKDFSVSQPKGIAADERTAVCIDKNGNAVVIGEGNAFFIISNKSLPEVCEKDQPLTWTNKTKALRVYIFKGSAEGTPAFNLTQWPTKKPTEYWFVRSGELFRKPN
jgi:cyanophycinase